LNIEPLNAERCEDCVISTHPPKPFSDNCNPGCGSTHSSRRRPLRLFPQEFFQPLDNFRRLRDHLFGQRFKLLTGYRFDGPSSLFCLGQKLAIFDCSIPRLAQGFYSLGRTPGGVMIGRPKIFAARMTVARRRPVSGVLYWSMSSWRVETSVNKASRFFPV